MPGNDFEVRQKETEDVLRKLGQLIGSNLPKGDGFSLHIFTGGGAMFYISNCPREQVIEALKEFILKYEGQPNG